MEHRMKRIILLITVLLSAFANANRVYDHVAAYRTNTPSEAGRTLRDMFTLKYIATYIVENGSKVKEPYVGIFGLGLPERGETFPLRKASHVNNLRSYEYDFNSRAFNITFIAMNGALYMMVDGENAGPIIIPEVTDNENVINVLKTDFGVVVVANQETIGHTKIRLLNLKINYNGGNISYSVIGDKEISDENARSAGSITFKSTSNNSLENMLVLLTDKNMYNFNVSDRNLEEKQKYPITRDYKYNLLPNDGGTISLVKYDIKNNIWYYKNDVFTEGKAQKLSLNIHNFSSYFDYAVTSVLNDSAIINALPDTTGQDKVHFWGLLKPEDKNNRDAHLISLRQELMGQKLVSLNTFYGSKKFYTIYNDQGDVFFDTAVLYLTVKDGIYSIFTIYTGPRYKNGGAELRVLFCFV